MLGNRVEYYSEIAKKVKESGHELGIIRIQPKRAFKKFILKLIELLR